MSDKKIIAEQKIKEVKEILVSSTDPDWWKFVTRTKQVCSDNDTPDAQYIAFYRTSPSEAITHIAKVKYTEKNIFPRVTYKNFPKILKKGEERGWIDKPHKVYHIEKLTKLYSPIEKGIVRRKWFKTWSELLEK